MAHMAKACSAAIDDQTSDGYLYSTPPLDAVLSTIALTMAPEVLVRSPTAERWRCNGEGAP